LSSNPHAGRNEARYAPGESERHWWLTPLHILELVRIDLGGTIGLDPCTFDDNPTGAEEYFTAEIDGLSRSWRHARSVFVNPPYGQAQEPWCECCTEVGAFGVPVVLLIPSATETTLFQRIAVTSTSCVLVHSRIPFAARRDNGRRLTSRSGVALLGWNTTLEACGSLGLRVVGWA
jgi:hypothetical protein